MCSHGQVSVLGAGPREQRGADLVGRPPDLLHHPSDSSAKTRVSPPERKQPVPTASCLQPRPAWLLPAQGCSAPGVLLTQTLSHSHLDPAVFVHDPSHSWGFDFSSSDLSFPIAPHSSSGNRSWVFKGPLSNSRAGLRPCLAAKAVRSPVRIAEAA